jgi:ATP-dependent DNA ligase
MTDGFFDFAELNDSLAATSKKLEKRALMVAYLRGLAVEDAARAALYLSGAAFAETDRRKLNVGGSLLSKALAARTGASPAAMSAAYRRHGDMGAAAQDLLETVPQGLKPLPQPAASVRAEARTYQDPAGSNDDSAGSSDDCLTLAIVEEMLDRIAAARGPGAKLPVVSALLEAARPVEVKYLLKLMLSDMRTGVKQSLVEEAIAAAYEVEASEVRRASMLIGNLPEVVRLAAEGRLGEARMKLFHPLGFMLASPVDSVDEAVERFTEEVVLEAATIPQGLKPFSDLELDVRAEARTLQDRVVTDVGAEVPTFRAPIVADLGATRREPVVAGAGAEAVSSPENVTARLKPGPDTNQNPSFNTTHDSSSASRQPSLPGQDSAGGDSSGAEAPSSLGAVTARLKPGPDTNQNPSFNTTHDSSSARPFDQLRAGYGAPAKLSAAVRIHGVLEDKYDGIRAQLHFGDASEPGRVELFSRSREDLSASFPELVEAFAAIGERAILDGEILAWSPDALHERSGRALPFSVLQQRIGRKRVTAEMREATPVVFMAFDAMFLGESLLLEEPLHERRRRLEEFVARHAALTANAEARGQVELFSGSENAFARLVLAPSVRLESAEQLDAAYAEARARGNEGVMLKSLDSKYQPGRRGLAWLKLKRELATLDVVVTGAEFGNGRRAAVLSDYTFAVRDGDRLLNVGKAYSGLTDAEIMELTAYFKEHTIEDYGHFRTVEPLKVLEVAFNNVMRSERHDSGFALRFPRIVRIRDDKPVEEIDTLARVEEVYQSQPDKGS